jgi:competence protein ComEA
VFYLSRGEQVALAVLVIGLLAGGGVLTYERGVRAGSRTQRAPRFVDVRAAPVPAAAAVPEPVAPVTRAAPPSPSRHAPAAAPKPAGPLSLNTATAAQLEALPGIGPKLAQRIIDHREQLVQENGRGFTSVDQLLDVSGIGPKRLAAVQGLVVP